MLGYEVLGVFLVGLPNTEAKTPQSKISCVVVAVWSWCMSALRQGRLFVERANLEPSCCTRHNCGSIIAPAIPQAAQSG
jgi:hypothetical protein